MKIKITILIFLLSASTSGYTERLPPEYYYKISDIRSPFNGIKLGFKDSTGQYSFVVSGHFHGSSSNQSGFPAASLLANIDVLNKMKLTFIASTGDLFMDPVKDFENYKSAFFQKLNAPLFNAVGNHDLSEKVGSYSPQKDQPNFHHFYINTELFIFLDTEFKDGSLDEKQFSHLKSYLESSEYGEKNIFIFSHRPIWSEEDEEMKDFFLDNTRSKFGNNFKSDVEPLLIEAAKTKNIFWCSGSLGNAPASFFYHQDENGITYIQSAIRDLPRDAMLKVNVDNGVVTFETFSLNNNKVEPLEFYNIDYWKKHYKEKEPFNYRLIPLYVKQTVFHRYFWYGIFATSFFVLLIWFIRKRRKKK